MRAISSIMRRRPTPDVRRPQRRMAACSCSTVSGSSSARHAASSVGSMAGPVFSSSAAATESGCEGATCEPASGWLSTGVTRSRSSAPTRTSAAGPPAGPETSVRTLPQSLTAAERGPLRARLGAGPAARVPPAAAAGAVETKVPAAVGRVVGKYAEVTAGGWWAGGSTAGRSGETDADRAVGTASTGNNARSLPGL